MCTAAGGSTEERYQTLEVANVFRRKTFSWSGRERIECSQTMWENLLTIASQFSLTIKRMELAKMIPRILAVLTVRSHETLRVFGPLVSPMSTASVFSRLSFAPATLPKRENKEFVSMIL